MRLQLLEPAHPYRGVLGNCGVCYSLPNCYAGDLPQPRATIWQWHQNRNLSHALVSHSIVVLDTTHSAHCLPVSFTINVNWLSSSLFWIGTWHMWFLDMQEICWTARFWKGFSLPTCELCRIIFKSFSCVHEYFRVLCTALQHCLMRNKQLHVAFFLNKVHFLLTLFEWEMSGGHQRAQTAYRSVSQQHIHLGFCLNWKRWPYNVQCGIQWP